MRAEGALIALTGPDGVGKTTAARTLLAGHDGPTAYVHFRPPVRGALEPGPPTTGVEGPPKVRHAPSRLDRVLGWGRLAKSFVLFWVGYLRVVRPALRRGALVVADRWTYGYVIQPEALRFYGPDWLARLAVSLMPRPTVLAVLRAPPEVVHGRKQQLTLSQIEEELVAWSGLSVHDPLFVDAMLPPEQVADSIVRRLTVRA